MSAVIIHCCHGSFETQSHTRTFVPLAVWPPGLSRHLPWLSQNEIL